MALRNTKGRLKAMAEDFKSLEWNHEVLLQRWVMFMFLSRYQQREQERDELKCSFVDKLVDIQQKSGLKAIILEKTVDDLKNSLEQKMVENKTMILTSGNIQDRLKAKKDMDTLLEEKNTEIRRLRMELANVS